MTRMRKPKSPGTVSARAKELRRSSTLAETVLWGQLRNRRLGAKFRRQVPIGPFIVDFFCHEASLVIEVDGNGHRGKAQMVLDRARTEWLEQHGYMVVRFKNEDVFGDLSAVTDAIQTATALSRQAGEGQG